MSAPIRGRWTNHRCAECGHLTIAGSIHGCVKCLTKRQPVPVEVVPVPDEAAIERAKEAAHEAYHAHNGGCECRTVGHLTECIAEAVLRALVTP